jgi:hypothetical protein
MKNRLAIRAVLGLAMVFAGRPPASARVAANQASTAPRRELFKDSRAQVAYALASGKRDISMIFASVPGEAPALAREIQRLGGVIRVQDDEIGYVRARIPLGVVDQVVSLPSVQTADVDNDGSGIPPYLSPGSSPADPEARLPRAPAAPDWPPKRAEFTDRAVYSPLSDMGGADWAKANPTYDGRGVTIAVLDGNLDFLLPEFQVATTLDGKPTRKVIDMLNGMDPRDPEWDYPHWIAMTSRVSPKGGRLRWAGETFQAPRAGSFRIGVFDPCRFSPYVVDYFRQVIARPELGGTLDRPIAVLWDPKSGEVWVDVDQDLDFKDETPLTDFAKRFEYGLLGKDDPDTPLREAIAFVVQTDPRFPGFVALNFAHYGHSTMVSGAAAGSRGTAGRFDGVAPGARLISLFQGATTHGAMESLIRVFRDPRVDVIVFEESVMLAMPYTLNDGRFTMSVLCGRLIEKYKKPLFIPANNAPGLNTTIEHGNAPFAFGVGAYESRENFLQNRAVNVRHEDNLHWVGSWGPSGNGALQPDILASSEVLTTHPGTRYEPGLKGVYDFAPGYAMCGGTSCAAPVAAGAAARLLSGARQAGFGFDPQQLYRAMTASARFIANIPAYRQGNGLIQIGAAWQLLKPPGVAAPPSIETVAPVKTVLSPWLSPPDAGPGIYEREGWAPGQKGERTITFTRTSGDPAPATYSVRWTGNDGTFSSAGTVTLPLNQPVSFTVAVAPESPGVHSALLSLHAQGRTDPASLVHRTMNTVVAAERFETSSGYAISKDVRVDRPGATELFFDVPAGVDVFRLEIRAPKDTIFCNLFPPDAREIFVYDLPKEGLQTISMSNPTPGVWAAVLPNRYDAFTFDETRASPLPPTSVSLSASLIGMNVQVPLVENASTGQAREIQVAARNRFAGFQGGIGSYPLASFGEVESRVAPREQKLFDIAVPRGTTQLLVELADVPEGADLDLYLFDCTGKSCETRRVRVGPDSRESISVSSPSPGSWKLVVDAARVPAGGAAFKLRDYFLDPTLGSLAAADAVERRDPDASWNAKASVWAASDPPAGRGLCAIAAGAGDGIAVARQAGGTDLGSFESWKTGRDAIPLGLSIIRLGNAP